MKKCFLLILLSVIFSGNSFAQLSLDKFLDEKIYSFDATAPIKESDLKKKFSDDVIEKLRVRISRTTDKTGKLTVKTITNLEEIVQAATQLKDILMKKLTAKFGRKGEESKAYGLTNYTWVKPDGTTYILSTKDYVTVLLMTKK